MALAAFQTPVVIKPDLTPKERNIKNFLQKWRLLIGLGFEEVRIKIRNQSDFIDTKLYDKFKIPILADHISILLLILLPRLIQVK